MLISGSLCACTNASLNFAQTRILLRDLYENTLYFICLELQNGERPSDVAQYITALTCLLTWVPATVPRENLEE